MAFSEALAERIRQALARRKFAADDCQNNLGRQLLTNADFALAGEPELHGRLCYGIAQASVQFLVLGDYCLPTCNRIEADEVF